MLPQQGIIDGKRPFVDVRYSNRTLIEKKLVEIMVRCWAPKRQDRPTIFEIVKYMRESKAAARKAGELQLSTRIKMAIATG